MAIGTAGYTASLCVDALLAGGVRPDQGEVLVTGATGGVGSIAIALLAKAGFAVAAVTGKSAEAPYLEQLGAGTVLDRAEFAEAGTVARHELVGSPILSVSGVLERGDPCVVDRGLPSTRTTIRGVAGCTSDNGTIAVATWREAGYQ